MANFDHQSLLRTAIDPPFILGYNKGGLRIKGGQMASWSIGDDLIRDARKLTELVSRKVVDARTGCWLYTGHLVEQGYGQIAYGYWPETGKIHIWPAHRLVYCLVNRDLFKDQVIRHICDVPSCINPEHLVAGTHQDNSDDKWSRGRGRFGEAHSGARLTIAEVREIVELRKTDPGTWTQARLAGKFGVSQAAIHYILKNATWKHVQDLQRAPEGFRTGERNARAKLTDAKVREMFELRSQGWMQSEIATYLGIGQVTVNNVLHRKFWAHVPIPEELLERANKVNLRGRLRSKNKEVRVQR